MKLTLFSNDLSERHIAKLKAYFEKPLSEVKFLFINTPAIYKPFKPEWLNRCENQWRHVFQHFQEFDLKHAYDTDPAFDFMQFYKDYDYIYVSGGNLYILSYWMKKTGSDKILEKLIREEEIVYGGESAGAIYPFNDLEPYNILDNPEKAPEEVNNGMGILESAPIPHWENSDYREGLITVKKVLEDKGYKTITITDNQGCFIEDNEIEVL